MSCSGPRREEYSGCLTGCYFFGRKAGVGKIFSKLQKYGPLIFQQKSAISGAVCGSHACRRRTASLVSVPKADHASPILRVFGAGGPYSGRRSSACPPPTPASLFGDTKVSLGTGMVDRMLLSADQSVEGRLRAAPTTSNG